MSRGRLREAWWVLRGKCRTIPVGPDVRAIAASRCGEVYGGRLVVEQGDDEARVWEKAASALALSMRAARR